MTVTQSQRDWLGDVFNVGRYAPDSPNFETEKAKLAFEGYLSQTKLKELVKELSEQGLDTKGLSQTLERLTNPAPTSKEGYASGKKDLEGIFKSASDLLLENRKKLQEKFKEFKAAQLYANNLCKAYGITINDGAIIDDNLRPSTKLLSKAVEISECEIRAKAAREANKFKEAAEELDAGINLFKEIEKEIEQAKTTGVEETKKAAASEMNAFELYGGTTKAMKDMVGDKELMSLMIGGKVDSTGQEKSPKLIAMEKVFHAAVERYDELKKSGLSPIDAAEIAFANIPRAFWPDKAIREIDMFMRVEAQIELDEANQEAKSISESMQGISDDYVSPLNEYANLGISTTGDYVEYILKDKLGLKTTGELPKNAKDIEALKINGEPASAEMKEFVKSQLALKDGFGIGAKATEGLGVFLKAVDCLKKTKDSIGEFEGPVQQKIAEFERNKAIFDLLIAAEKYGANLMKDICPALGAASAGVDAVVAVIQAARYFKMLSDINSLGERAERDPKSVVYLPLIRMAKHERIKAAEQVMKFVESALAVAGKSAELSGIGAMAGLGIDAASKIVAQGSKFVFANIKWSDAKKAQKFLLEVKGPPLNRELVVKVFEYSNKYATYCLAIAAVEDNDTWAIRYCITNGLNEGEVSDPATSIMVLRKYILIKAEMSDDQETFGDTLVGKAGTFAVEKLEQMKDFIGDKIVGRDTSFEYQPPTILDPETGTYLPNENYVDLGVPEPTRSNWQAAKEKAVKTGWYDDRSGLGDELTRYQLALTGWENFKNQKPNFLNEQLDDNDLVAAEALHIACRNLVGFISAIKPLANDGKQKHEAMDRYLNGMIRKVQDVSYEIDEIRSMMISKVLGTRTEEEISEELKKAAEKQKLKDEVNIKAFNGALEKLIVEQKWETPFGSSTLANYEALVCDKLGISTSLIDGKISQAADELKRDLLEEAGDYLGAYSLEQLGGAYKTIYGKILKKTAYDALDKLGSQARDVRDFASETASRDLSDLKPAIKMDETCHDNWKTVVKAAVGRGMLSAGTSEIAGELKSYITEFARYKDSGIFHYKANALDQLRKLQIRLKDKYAPVDMDGLRFDPMVKYVQSFLKTVAEKIAELDKEELPGWTPTKLGANDDLTEKWWKDEKKAAITNLMKDSSTGIGKAVAVLVKEKDKYGKSAKKAADLKPYLKALASLRNKVVKFAPQTPSGKSHPGGNKMRKIMLSKLEAYQSDIEKNSTSFKEIGNLNPKSIQEVNAEKWAKDKQTFIDHGLIDESTGIGKALKAFNTAKTKYTTAKSKKTNDEGKLREAFVELGGRLITAAINAQPKDGFDKEFTPAEAYLKKLVELVNADIK